MSIKPSRLFKHRVTVTRDSATPDPTTKKTVASSSTIATGLACMLEGINSVARQTSLGDVTQGQYVMTWTPSLSPSSPGPFLRAGDLVGCIKVNRCGSWVSAPAFFDRVFEVSKIVDDTVREEGDPIMTCELTEKAR